MCVVEVYLPNWIKKKIRFIQFFLINSGVSLDVSGIDAAVIGFEIGVQFRNASFTILHITLFSIYIFLYFGPKYKAQNFITTLYNFYKAKKKKKTLQTLH